MDTVPVILSFHAGESALALGFLHLLLESLQGAEVTESCLLDGLLNDGFLLALLTLGVLGGGSALSADFCLVGVFGDAGVGKDDALAVFVELDDLEVQLLVELGLGSIFLDKVFGSCESLYTVVKSDNSALVHYLDNGSLMDGANVELAFESIPGVILKLLVAEAETTVVLVDFENLHLDVASDGSELGRMLDFLGPGEVGDVDKAVYALFDFNEDTEVGEVADAGGVA